MVCTQVEALPQLSVAFQVRVITCPPAQVPGVSTSVKVMTGAGSQLSVAVALPLAAGVTGSWQLIVTSAGQVMTGGVLSCIVIVWIQVEAFPQLSVAFQVRVTTWLPGQLPKTSVSLKVITGAGSQLSVAVALPVVPGVTGSWQLIVTFAGQVITGGVIS
jgi:hypothetical protein